MNHSKAYPLNIDVYGKSPKNNIVVSSLSDNQHINIPKIADLRLLWWGTNIKEIVVSIGYGSYTAFCLSERSRGE